MTTVVFGEGSKAVSGAMIVSFTVAPAAAAKRALARALTHRGALSVHANAQLHRAPAASPIAHTSSLSVRLSRRLAAPPRAALRRPLGAAWRANILAGVLNVLLTNDDGIDAEGLHAMRAALAALPDVRLVVIAPDGNRSAMARSITTNRPLWVEAVHVPRRRRRATRPTARPSIACASRA